VPVFCGGTGLYFKALLDGLGDAPPSDVRLRATLDATPLGELLAELEQRDPEAYAVIDRKNPRRVVRAMEVIRLTGRKFSAQRAVWKPGADPGVSPTRFLCLTRPMPDLLGRINSRVEEMFAAGLVAETRSLLERGLDRNPTALQALGYRQVMEHLRGARDLAETVELVKMRTRQFARRQLTWFRKHARATWLDISSDSGLREFKQLTTLNRG
jgi:tRNA dimethylallyltransferase